MPALRRVRQDALIGHRDCPIAVIHLETDRQRVAARDTLPGVTRPPRRIRAPGRTCFSTTSVGGEEDDGVLQGAEHQEHRDREYADADDGAFALLPRRRSLNSPLSFLPLWHPRSGVQAALFSGSLFATLRTFFYLTIADRFAPGCVRMDAVAQALRSSLRC